MRKCKNCDSPAAEKQSRCYPCRNVRRRAKGLIPAEGMKILLIDIETRPNVVYTWDIWNVNIGIDQIIEPGGLLCFAAKWHGEENVEFYSSWEIGDEAMILEAWRLLDEADIVVHYYGSRFDVPHLNAAFLKFGYPPPSPFKQVDLKMAVSRRFKFTSNKLQFVSEVLELEGKEEHEGFRLWKKVLNGDEDARARMQSYNVRDVTLLEEVYEILLPWIPGHPNRHLYNGHGGCPSCGINLPLVDAGYSYTNMSKFPQYYCSSCFKYFRGTKRISGVKLTESVLS